MNKMVTILIVFLVVAGALACEFCGSRCRCPEDCPGCLEKQQQLADYSLILMSDTHYDKKKYDTNSVLPSYWQSEATRNYGMWDNGDASLSYQLLDQAKGVVDEKTVFALNAGDLTQGDFDSEETTAQANQAAIDDITARIGLPLYTAVDNHDYCRTISYMDPGRYSTYDPSLDDQGYKPTSTERVKNAACSLDVLRNYIATGLKVDRLSSPVLMTKKYGQDVYIFTMASDAGLAYLNQELKRFPKEEVRHTFVIIHLPPVLGKNYGNSKQWQTDCFHYYVQNESGEWVLKQRNADLQASIQADLAAREAIVFSGHKHYWELIDAEYPEGTIHQLMTNANDVSFDWEPCDSVEGFEESAAKEGKGSTLSKGDASKITRYGLWSDRGFVKLLINDGGVSAEIYSSNANKLLTTIVLKETKAEE